MRANNSLRRLAPMLACGALLSACASAPAPTRPPQAVELQPERIWPGHSSFNARVLADGVAVNHSFAASLDPRVQPVLRLESSYSYELNEQDAQLRLGDAVSSSGWGAAVRYAGVHLGGPGAARDDVVATAGLAASGIAVLPTMQEALFESIGGGGAMQAKRMFVAPSLNTHTTNPFSIYTKDLYGRDGVVHAPLIAPLRFVDAGCADFALDAGRVRRDYAIVSNEYGPTYAGARLACAAPLGFTVESRGEYLQDSAASLGLGLTRPLGWLGAASAVIASSRAEEAAGWLARVGFERDSTWLRFAWRTDIQSRSFRELGAPLRNDPVMTRDLASVGVKFDEVVSVSLAYAAQTTWGRTRSDLLALQQRFAFGERGSFGMSAAYSLQERLDSSVLLTYHFVFGAIRRSPVMEFDPQLLQR